MILSLSAILFAACLVAPYTSEFRLKFRGDPSKGNGVEEVIPTNARRIELPYEAESVEAFGYQGERLNRTCEFEVGNGRTLLSAPFSGIYSWRVKRRVKNR